MARLGGLGKGLGALIPAGSQPTATRPTAPRLDRGSPVECDPAPTATSRACTSTRSRWPSSPPRSARSASCSRCSSGRSTGGYRADRRRAALAGRPPGRPAVIPAIVRDDRRSRLGRAGARREPASPGPDAARGGRRLPAAHRGLRSDPRAGGDPRRQEPLGGHQHPAPDVAARRRSSICSPTAACPPVMPRRCSARPTVRSRSSSPAAAVAEGWPVRTVEEAVRDSQRGRHRARRRSPATSAPADGAARRAPAAPAGPARARGLLADSSSTSVSVQMGAKRGKVIVEFADLEDLERIYRDDRAALGDAACSRS